MIPRLGQELCAGLREAFRRVGYDVDGVPELLGPVAHAALGRDEPVPARLASEAGGPLGTLVRLFLLGDPEPEAAVAEALDPVSVPAALDAGLLRRTGPTEGGPGALAAALDVRPYGFADGADDGSWWVVSDLDLGRLQGRAERPATDHVLGVGQASLSLSAATVRRPVARLLDLGTGCGVQALHATRHAERVVATDVNERALALAAATFALSGVDNRVELRAGSWLEPVTGELFDQIVCNPPFVVGPPRVRFTYRDSGLAGDEVAAQLVGALPELLTEGGVAQLLACWLHVRGQDWPERVVSWLPPTGGLDAWFVQREVADPALYVATWLRDSGMDPASPAARSAAERWLAWFDEQRVEGVGFGFVTLRRTGGGGTDATVLCEDLRQALADPLGRETAGWLDRLDWLRTHADDESFLAARLVLAPTVVLEQTACPGADGWQPVRTDVRRLDGPGWRHEVDEPAAALLAGCQGALPLGELLALLAYSADRPVDELAAASLPSVRELVRHGLLLPAEWIPDGDRIPARPGAAGGPAVEGVVPAGGANPATSATPVSGALGALRPGRRR